jgi:DNA-binding response OmpR family regulator
MTEHTILIIEDDPAMLRGLQDNFESHGYRVRTARDGQAGLEAALDGPCDLVLLDIMLPKLNGYEVCRRIRMQGLEMPIVMLTAKGQEEDIVRGLEWGADDYVTKPFSIRQLLARVHAFLRRRENEAVERIRFGDCELDLAAHKLFKRGVETPLTAKEFRLLAHFLHRPGRAMTRKEILDAVWGRSVIVTARSVDRCVTTLRAKIEADPRRPLYIQTVRDIGYRFQTNEPDGETSFRM